MIFSFMRPVAAVFNHLIAQDAWARAKLAAQCGKTVCIDSGIMQVRLSVTADGFVENAVEDAVPTVTIRVKLADVPLILANRERAISHVRIEGDADFANTVSQLSQSLRWDAEDDLGKVVGDIAATRIVSGVRSALAATKTTQRQFAENLAEYFVEEQPMLIPPHALTAFSSNVVTLRDDLERLSKRIEKLERR